MPYLGRSIVKVGIEFVNDGSEQLDRSHANLVGHFQSDIGGIEDQGTPNRLLVNIRTTTGSGRRRRDAGFGGGHFVFCAVQCSCVFVGCAFIMLSLSAHLQNSADRRVSIILL